MNKIIFLSIFLTFIVNCFGAKISPKLRAPPVISPDLASLAHLKSKLASHGQPSRNSRIMEGEVAPQRAFNYVGFLTCSNEYRCPVTCIDMGQSSGTMYVLTAANCVVGKPRDQLKLVMETNNKNTMQPTAKIFDIFDIILPPNYDMSYWMEDLCLIRVQTMDDDHPGIEKIPLCSQDWTLNDLAGKAVNVTGWGVIGGSSPDALQWTSMTIQGTNCQAAAESWPESWMCLESNPDSSGGLSQGDQGTGVVYTDEWGKKCLAGVATLPIEGGPIDLGTNLCGSLGGWVRDTVAQQKKIDACLNSAL